MAENKRLGVLLLILAFTVGFAANLVLIKTRGEFFSLSQTPVPISPTPIPQPKNVLSSLPIDPQSDGVKSLKLLYLLQGVVNNIEQTGQKPGNGYTLQVLTPRGNLFAIPFWVSDQTATIVKVDTKGRETKYALSSIKKNDSIMLNYYLDPLLPSEAQVTKVMVLINQ